MSQILASPSAGHASKKMGLLPLEFADCLLDSPYFRENLRAHEKQLDQTSADIKGIIKDVQVNHTIFPIDVAYGRSYIEPIVVGFYSSKVSGYRTGVAKCVK